MKFLIRERERERERERGRERGRCYINNINDSNVNLDHPDIFICWKEYRSTHDDCVKCHFSYIKDNRDKLWKFRVLIVAVI